MTNTAPTVQPGSNGRFYVLDGRKVVATFRSLDSAQDFAFGPVEGPTCSICDGLGHGYPGGGPCPLEERGWDDNDDEYRLAALEMAGL